MGDRCNVVMTILESQAELVKQILKHHGNGSPDEEIINEDIIGGRRRWVDIHFDEVNHGQLNGIEVIHANGIPYNLFNDSGSSFGSATEYCRYLENGELQVFTVGSYDDYIDIDELKVRLNNYDALRDYITECDYNRTPEPWDNQEEYAARYRAIQTISPE